VKHENRRRGAHPWFAAGSISLGRTQGSRFAHAPAAQLVAIVERLADPGGATVVRIHLNCESVSVHRREVVSARLAA
jgi:hypothetical protein